jgi:hypothetical protein
MTLAAAAPLALVTDTVSITAMELVDNAIMLVIPGALNDRLSHPLFLGRLCRVPRLVFVPAYPVHWWLIRAGHGHAVIHQHYGVIEGRTSSMCKKALVVLLQSHPCLRPALNWNNAISAHCRRPCRQSSLFKWTLRHRSASAARTYED